MPHFMIVLIPYINILNLSWIKNVLFLRNMEPLMKTHEIALVLLSLFVNSNVTCNTAHTSYCAFDIFQKVVFA